MSGRLSLNQATIRSASLAEALEATRAAGIESIGVWREPVHAVGLDAAAEMVRESGLRVSTLCRGGFLTAVDPEARRRSIEENIAAITETRVLADAGADGSRSVLVLVVGGLPDGDRDLAGARGRVADALGELVPVALDHGVTLALEPLHPMYASDRAVVNTLRQALQLARVHPPEAVGVAVDTFHIWWDPDVSAAISDAGADGRIATYQVCDWQTPLADDVLLSRHQPGDGVIDFAGLTRAVQAAGYSGDIEVEIFNQDIWNTPFDVVARDTVRAFDAVIAPTLRS